MGQAPSTVVQVTLLVLFVLPGVTYQFLRERWRGPTPEQRDLGERVLRAIAASILLDALYLVVAGPELLTLALGTDSAGWEGFAQRSRVVGLVALVLFIVVPAAAAASVSWVQQRRLKASYRGTPTAWDHAFRDRRPCFVRARLKDGSWVGGWYGTRSYATSYPQQAELFLESARRMNSDGSFGTRVNQTAGLHLRASDIDLLEFVESSETRSKTRETS
ncbi:MAG: DUF6338 family protein [Pseudonocardiaceae bacterium]